MCSSYKRTGSLSHRLTSYCIPNTGDQLNARTTSIQGQRHDRHNGQSLRNVGCFLHSLNDCHQICTSLGHKMVSLFPFCFQVECLATAAAAATARMTHQSGPTSQQGCRYHIIQMSMVSEMIISSTEQNLFCVVFLKSKLLPAMPARPPDHALLCPSLWCGGFGACGEQDASRWATAAATARRDLAGGFCAGQEYFQKSLNPKMTLTIMLHYGTG